jgi:hypothetical protein
MRFHGSPSSHSARERDGVAPATCCQHRRVRLNRDELSGNGPRTQR